MSLLYRFFIRWIIHRMAWRLSIFFFRLVIFYIYFLSRCKNHVRWFMGCALEKNFHSNNPYTITYVATCWKSRVYIIDYLATNHDRTRRTIRTQLWEKTRSVLAVGHSIVTNVFMTDRTPTSKYCTPFHHDRLKAIFSYRSYGGIGRQKSATRLLNYNVQREVTIGVPADIVSSCNAHPWL